MKKILFVLLDVFAFLFVSRNALADDYSKYYQYMTNQKVEVAQDHVTFSFNWKQDMNGIFKEGDEFELGVMIDPKYFAKPWSGSDAKLRFDYTTNIRCGTRDVYNYTQPSLLGANEVFKNILQGCDTKDLTNDQLFFIYQVSQQYVYGKADSAANFTMVTTCPEQFKKNAPGNVPYYFTYYLKPVPQSEFNSYPENLCGGPGYFPDWGFFWITAKVQPDTLTSRWDNAVKVSDCPYLIGLPDEGPLTAYLSNQGKTTPVFNRGCAPTGTIPWGFSDPLGNNWHNPKGQKFVCQDCDNDGFYANQSVPMYGTQTGDCNDANAGVHPGADELYGNGVDENCDGCADKICFASAGPGNPCAYDAECSPGVQFQSLCPNGIDAKKEVCNASCQWEIVAECPAVDPTCGNACGQGTVCNPSTGICELDPNVGSGGNSGSGGQSGTGGSGNCSCVWGPCCDGCDFLSSAYVCDGYNVYQCEGPGLGQDGQQAVINTYCSGFSSDCNGSTTQGPWLQYQDCSSSQQCQMNGNLPVCVAVQPCSDVFLFDASFACQLNSGSVGSPTICLEIQQVSGPTWKYRVCKQGSPFADSFTHHLLDQNHLPQDLGGPYANVSGNSCSQWHDFDVSYIPGYGAVNGAGLVGEIKSPSACSQASCTYHTGLITIRKECQ